MPNTMHLFLFENLAQRVLYRYEFTFANFVPIESEEVSIEAQRAFYDICSGIVHDIADNPEIFGLTTDHPDFTMGAHHVLSMYPSVYKVRNACQKTFNELAAFMFTVGLHGLIGDDQLTVDLSDFQKMSAKTLGIYCKLLSRYGVTTEKNGETVALNFPDCPEMFYAWKLLADKCTGYPDERNKRAARFILWIHNDDVTYFKEKLRTLLGLEKGFFDYISEKYLENGYEFKYEIDEFSSKLIYAKDVSGLSIEFSTLLPTVRFVNNTSIGIKTALENADELTSGIKEQFIRFCKPCNDCMGCTKSGKNVQFTITIRNGGNEYRLCPEFVQIEWYNNDVSKEKIDFLFEINELQERFGKNWRKKK